MGSVSWCFKNWRGERTVEDDIGYALDEWVLVTLAVEESAERSLVVGEDLREVPKDFGDKFWENRFTDDGW